MVTMMPFLGFLLILSMLMMSLFFITFMISVLIIVSFALRSLMTIVLAKLQIQFRLFSFVFALLFFFFFSFLGILLLVILSSLIAINLFSLFLVHFLFQLTTSFLLDIKWQWTAITFWTLALGWSSQALFDTSYKFFFILVSTGITFTSA